MKRNHGPIPKGLNKLNGSGNSRRRMDRGTERRLSQLKRWRTRRAKELGLDPGVMCPNSALEAIAWLNPREGSELANLSEVKGWFAESFADEVTEALRSADSAEA
jgi:ribonuclease D